MKIYEQPMCNVPNCKNKGWCLYSGMIICGEHLTEITKKTQDKKRKEALELIENA